MLAIHIHANKEDFLEYLIRLLDEQTPQATWKLALEMDYKRRAK